MKSADASPFPRSPRPCLIRGEISRPGRCHTIWHQFKAGRMILLIDELRTLGRSRLRPAAYAREFRHLTSIRTSSPSRHGPNRKAVAEDDEIAWDGLDTWARQDHPN